MRHALVVSACLIFAIASGCATGSTAPPASQAASPSSSPVQSEAPSEAVSEIVGFWHRAQTCQEMQAAFEHAGLAESHTEWLQGNFYGGEPGPESGDLCAGAEGPLEHSHWFTADGEFGSHDQNGEEVDGGDYQIVDADTLSFPSHATEFGYSGELVVDDHRRHRDVRCGTPGGMRRPVQGRLCLGPFRVRIGPMVAWRRPVER